MLFFYNDELKNDKSYLLNECDKILAFLISFYNVQKNNKALLLVCMDKMSVTINNLQDTNNTDIIFYYLGNIKKSFDAINLNICKLDKLKTDLDKIKNELQMSSINASVFSLIDTLNHNYDAFYKTMDENNLLISNFLSDFVSFCHFTLSDTNVSMNKENVPTPQEKSIENHIVVEQKKDVQPQEDNSKEEKDSILDRPLKDNTTLLISEKNNSVYLPYLLKDVKNIFEKNTDKYADLQDVINKNYIVPLSRFKNPILSRFKEAFSLMKNKEKASISQCLDLALELAFNSLLNPAVIVACKNLDELDIYLDCLDNNELNKFTIFETIYEIAPSKR